MNRTKKETQAIIRRANFLRRILKENGLTLHGFDPGVSALKKTGVKDWEGRDHTVCLDFSRSEWGWIEPLLLELRKLRKSAAKRTSE